MVQAAPPKVRPHQKTQLTPEHTVTKPSQAPTLQHLQQHLQHTHLPHMQAQHKTAVPAGAPERPPTSTKPGDNAQPRLAATGTSPQCNRGRSKQDRVNRTCQLQAYSKLLAQHETFTDIPSSPAQSLAGHRHEGAVQQRPHQGTLALPACRLTTRCSRQLLVCRSTVQQCRNLTSESWGNPALGKCINAVATLWSREKQR